MQSTCYHYKAVTITIRLQPPGLPRLCLVTYNITMAGWPLKEENYYAEAAKTAKDIIGKWTLRSGR